MTITREALDAAAFWGHFICLDCGTQVDPEDVEESFGVVPCPRCEDEPLMERATRVAEIIAKVDPHG